MPVVLNKFEQSFNQLPEWGHVLLGPNKVLLFLKEVNLKELPALGHFSRLKTISMISEDLR